MTWHSPITCDMRARHLFYNQFSRKRGGIFSLEVKCSFSSRLHPLKPQGKCLTGFDTRHDYSAALNWLLIFSQMITSSWSQLSEVIFMKALPTKCSQALTQICETVLLLFTALRHFHFSWRLLLVKSNSVATQQSPKSNGRKNCHLWL